MRKTLGLLGAMSAMFEMSFTPTKKRPCGVDHVNPHKFPRFETDGFVTYSYNQQAHDDKYAAYCKKKGI